MSMIEGWKKFQKERNGAEGANGEVLSQLSGLLLPDEESDDAGCSLLREFKREQSDEFKDLIDGLASNPSYFPPYRATTALRVETIECFMNSLDRVALGLLLNKHLKQFHCTVWDDVPETTKKSAAWKKLSSKLGQLVDETVTAAKNNDQKALSSPTADTNEQNVPLNSRFSYRQPGVALLVDTLLELEKKSFSVEVPKSTGPNDWQPGHTWVLTAMNSNGNSADGLPPGLLLRLRIEKLSNGCGAIYPHPHLAAHVGITKSFAAGIRNAWAVVLNSETNLIDYDFRWSMTVVEPKGTSFHGLALPLKQWLIRASLDGESATLAFALALKSVMKGERLRQDIAATACFRDTNDNDEQFGWGLIQNNANPSLYRVGGLSEKEEVIKLCDYVGIKAFVVEKEQKAALPFNTGSIPESGFESAYRSFTEFEKILEEHAELVSTHWPKMTEKPDLKSIDDLDAKQERLDLHVWPQLTWEVSNPRKKADEDNWIRTPVGGTDHGQLKSVFTKLRDPNWRCHLVVHDGAGSGKTVLSLLIQHHATHPKLRQELFGDGLPRLVVRYEKKLESLDELASPTLAQILAADPDLISLANERKDSAHAFTPLDVVYYALKQNRVVIMIDGYDEFTEPDKIKLRNLFDTTSRVHESARDPKKVLWILLGRERAIDVEQSVKQNEFVKYRCFSRLRIELLSKEKQDEAVERAFPDLKSREWRNEMMPDLTKGEQNQLLGLPHTLNQIVRLITEHRITNSLLLPVFESQSDLFLQTEKPLLERAINKRNNHQRTEDVKFGNDIILYLVLEIALSCLAFDIAVKRLFRSVDGDQAKDVKKAALQRFKRILNEFDEAYAARQNAAVVFEWTYERLGTIATSNRGPNTEFGEEIIAFRTNRVFENYVARFLTKFAMPPDLVDVRNFIGDPNWEYIWRWSVKMPLKDRAIVADHAKYAAATRLLFERPQNKEHRRPTKMMYMTFHWLETRDFNIPHESNSLRAQLEMDLQKQFQEICKGISGVEKGIANVLLKDSNYVALCRGQLPGDNSRLYDFSLEPFYIAKYTVTNNQFQLFDDNFLGERIEDSFKAPNNPAIYVNWYDAYWFCRFISVCGGKQFMLPTEIQWEYACRAGSTGKWCFGDDDSKLKKYAWFWSSDPVSTTTYSPQGNSITFRRWSKGNSRGTTHKVGTKFPNAWGIHDMYGNVDEWCNEWDEEWLFDCNEEVRLWHLKASEWTRCDLGIWRRIFCGGNCFCNEAEIFSRTRSGVDPNTRRSTTGLRLALIF